MSIYDEDSEEFVLPGDSYQLLLLHDTLAHDFPSFDLGVMSKAHLTIATTFVASASDEAGLEAYDGPVTNVLEAWGSPSYRVWVIPVGRPHEQCYEYNDEGLSPVPFSKDPR